jgi:hypothetical protein
LALDVESRRMNTKAGPRPQYSWDGLGYPQYSGRKTLWPAEPPKQAERYILCHVTWQGHRRKSIREDPVFRIFS